MIKAQEWSTARAVEEDSFVKRAQKCVQNVFKKVFLVNPTFCFRYIYTKCKKWGWLWRGFLCEKSAEMCVCVSVELQKGLFSGDFSHLSATPLFACRL